MKFAAPGGGSFLEAVSPDLPGLHSSQENPIAPAPGPRRTAPPADRRGGLPWLAVSLQHHAHGQGHGYRSACGQSQSISGFPVSRGCSALLTATLLFTLRKGHWTACVAPLRGCCFGGADQVGDTTAMKTPRMGDGSESENDDGVFTREILPSPSQSTQNQSNEKGSSFCRCSPARDDGFNACPFSGQKLQLPTHERQIGVCLL